MNEKPEALADRLDDERMNLIERLADENERLRELLTEAKDLAWSFGADSLLDRINAALRREDV